MDCVYILLYICVNNNKKTNFMKNVKITFGTGNDAMIHNIEVSNPNEITAYLLDLKNAGWNLSEITSIVGGWTF